jgi:hypothetical protein
MKRNWVISLAAVVVLLLASLYFLQGSHTPPGQPILVELNAQALSGLQAEFNRTSASLRVILLLSPT